MCAIAHIPAQLALLPYRSIAGQYNGLQADLLVAAMLSSDWKAASKGLDRAQPLSLSRNQQDTPVQNFAVMDTATVTVPSCQLVDLNNNCQCRSTGAPRTRAPQALEVSAALLKPFVQLRQQQTVREKQLVRIVRSSIQKRHNPKWHPYRVELQQKNTKSNVDQAEQIVEGATMSCRCRIKFKININRTIDSHVTD